MHRWSDRWSKGLVVSGLGCAMAVGCLAQGQAQDKDRDDTKPALEERKPLERAKRPENKVSIPAGAQILLRLEHAITTKSAKIGDPIYAVTTFPYAVDGQNITATADAVDAQGQTVKTVFMHIYDGKPHPTTAWPAAYMTQAPTRESTQTPSTSFARKTGKPCKPAGAPCPVTARLIR